MFQGSPRGGRMARSLAILLVVGCGKDDASDSRPTATESPGVQSAACTLDPEHALLIRCEATLGQPDAVDLVLSAPGVPERRFPSDAATELDWLAWGLKPETTYTWTVGTASGEVSTGALPTGFAEAVFRLEGASKAFDAMLTPLRCVEDYFVLIDGEGDIIWYLYEPLYANAMDAYDWAPDGPSLLVGNNDRFVELAMDGTPILELKRPAWDGELHHDVERVGGLTWLLTEHPLDEWFVDGLWVFEGETPVGSWRLEDWLPPSGQPGYGQLARDWSHGNGIEATADGDIVLSLRTLDTVLALDGDPESAGFLEVLWVAGGTDGAPGSADFGPPPGGAFGDQHNANRVGDSLFLFDNIGDGDGSRAGRYTLDDASGQVVVDETWSMGSVCPIQGGAEPLAGGGVLATCATGWFFREFESANAEPVWSLAIDCANPLGPLGGESLNRGIPVVFAD